jgi:DNA mismatch repair protein MutL
VRVAYRDVSVTGVNPFYVVFLTLPPEEVDVNVHPTKSEVRFRNSGAVFQAVSGAVRRALQGGGGGTRPPDDRVERDRAPLPTERMPFRRPLNRAGEQPSWNRPPSSGSAPAVHEPGPRPLARAEVMPGQWRLVGQLHNSYILVEDRQGLLVVDQHVAHERVLYERYLQGLRQDRITVQGLLVPAVIETDPAAGAILEPLLPQLAQLGIELEHFGGSTFLHKGHPDFLEQFEVQPFLEDVVTAVRDRDRTAEELAREIRQRLLISAACHAAIKINTPLVREKMEQLLADLLLTENPLFCPHGRPIVLRVPLAGIERSFLRS